MNGELKIKVKSLLMGNTLKLFFISFLSIVIRWTLFFGSAFALYFLWESGLVTKYLALYNKYVLIAAGVAVIYILRFVISLIISGVRLGEQYIYFKKATCGCVKIRKLFSFLSPKKSAKAFALYLKINVYKSLWALMFLSPSVFSGLIIYYIYSTGSINLYAFWSLVVGASALLLWGLIYCRLVFLRYAAAPYFICQNKKTRVNDAIAKSIMCTDGFLKSGFWLHFSLIGWVVSSVLVFPLIYVLPYLKLAFSAFAVKTAEESAEKTAPAPIKEKASAPVILLHLKEIE